MTNIKVIIGASYGDEGKGLATDFFGSVCKESTIGILMNGGPQRGHTVETEDGIRRVFHHFSSSTLNGHTTYCGEEFLVNPMVCMEEYHHLTDLGYRPSLVIHPRCRFTTPYDMLINQIVLSHRGIHNSCGMGIWETIVRYRHPEFRLLIGDFADLSAEDRISWLRRVRDFWLPERLRQQGIESIPPEFEPLFTDEGILMHYLEDMETMLRIAPLVPEEYLKYFHNVLFENGQGLLLDGRTAENKEESTPSTTGVGRVFHMIETTFQDADVEVCYVSRSYLTRHGDGTLPGECRREDINPAIFDATNEPNPFQGTLRYGVLGDTDTLIRRIHGDFARCSAGKNRYQSSILFTHLNESPVELAGISDAFDRVYASDGYTAASVTQISGR